MSVCCTLVAELYDNLVGKSSSTDDGSRAAGCHGVEM